jgi:phenylpyruvate tautomerase PptA (4-oxalocrotonate tautomerase family)
LAKVAIPPVLPAGKEPRNFGLHRVKQLAGIPEVTDIIQLAPATPPPADRTWVLLTEAPKGGWGLGGHANTKRVVVGSDLNKSPAFGAFLCWRWRAGAGDKVAYLVGGWLPHAWDRTGIGAS